MTDAARWPATARLFARQRFGMHPGLDRTRALLARLGDPQRTFAAVLVGGTNGKGTATAVLDEVLRADGRSVGRFTSPHLVRPGERIRTHGRDADNDRFERLARRVLPHADAVDATFFEILVAMACLAFAEDGTELGLFEVGMGGRLDATNALEPVASAIARIALDHTEVLGNDVATIAREKAGIVRRGAVVWTSARGEALRTVHREAVQRGATVRSLRTREEGLATIARDRVPVAALMRTLSASPRGSRLRIEARGGPPFEADLPLVGLAAAENAALALCLARELGAGAEALRRGAAQVRWPGRFERVLGRVRPYLGVPIRFDGAHNPDGAAALARTLRRFGARPALVFGAARDKAIEAIVAELAGATGPLFVTRALNSPRAEAPDRIVARLERVGLRVAGAYDDPRDAVAAALAASGPRTAARAEAMAAVAEGATADGPSTEVDDAAVVVAGSLHLVGEVRAWWTGDPLPEWERWQ